MKIESHAMKSTVCHSSNAMCLLYGTSRCASLTALLLIHFSNSQCANPVPDCHRCLAVDAPSPEEKLSWLSDIAQEHGVEWDAHAAALEMLPAEKQGGYGPPGGGPSFSAGGPGFGPGPGSSDPGFGGGAGSGSGGYQQPQQMSNQQRPVTTHNNAPFLHGMHITA